MYERKRKRFFRNNEKIIKKGNDRRKKIKDLSEFPYSPIGLVKMKFGGTQYFGTGVMINPMMVLTCAHNVYEIDNQRKAQEVEFIPNGNSDIFGIFKVLEYYFSDEFIVDEKEDYAILLLDSLPGLFTGYYDLKIIENLEGNIGIYGYPVDKGDENNKEMWGMDTKIYFKDNDKLKYDIDTEIGQSGSPILFKRGEKYDVIGVHNKFVNNQDFNEGVLITKYRLKNIEKWIIKGISKYKNKFDEDVEKYILKDNIKLLDLTFDNLGDEGIKELCNINLEFLKIIKLGYNNISNKGASFLSKKNFKFLEKLEFKNNKLGIKGMEYISKMDFSNLQELNLSENQIGDDGIEFLLNMNLEKLKRLYLQKNEIKVSGIKHFLGKKLENLEILDLSHNHISAKAMYHLSKLNLINLKELNLTNNSVRNEGIKYLINNLEENFPKMEILYINSTLITSNGLENFLEVNLENFSIISYCHQLNLDEITKLEEIFSEIKNRHPKIFINY